jgi:excisionase family DNA binding protein
MRARILAHVGPDGSVLIPPRVAKWLKKRLGPTLDRRILMRDTDPDASAALTALYQVGLGWRPSDTVSDSGTKVAAVHHESVDWCTTTEAARIAGVTDRTVRYWIKRQRLPATKHGGRYLVSRRHIDVVTRLTA